MDSTQTPYKGIGGWLILVAIGLIFTPIRLGATLANDIIPAFQEEVWSALTTPGSESYHQYWAPVLIFELLGNGVFILFDLLLLFLFFSRKRAFRPLVIVFYLSNLAFVTTDFFVADLIPAVVEEPDSSSQKELLRTVLACLIWVPYFIVSKRVAGTFTK